jgi:hypothetical protein
LYFLIILNINVVLVSLGRVFAVVQPERKQRVTVQKKKNRFVLKHFGEYSCRDTNGILFWLLGLVTINCAFASRLSKEKRGGCCC